jgi:hypothetical protein
MLALHNALVIAKILRLEVPGDEWYIYIFLYTVFLDPKTELQDSILTIFLFKGPMPSLSSSLHYVPQHSPAPLRYNSPEHS